MTDSEFEDLVNRYLDRDVTPVEIEFLKDEVQANAARCLLFQEYVAIHRASKAAMTQPVVKTIGIGRLLGSAAMGVVAASVAIYLVFNESNMGFDASEFAGNDTVWEGTLVVPKSSMDNLHFVIDTSQSRAQVQEMIRRHFEQMKQGIEIQTNMIEWTTNANGDATIRFEVTGPQHMVRTNKRFESILTQTGENSGSREVESLATFSIYR